MRFRIFNFGQIKTIFLGNENLKKILIANVNVNKYINFIKPDKYFITNLCLVTDLKQNRFEIK